MNEEEKKRLCHVYLAPLKKKRRKICAKVKTENGVKQKQARANIR